MESVVVLCSGGINSFVAAVQAKQDRRLQLLHVRYPHLAADREQQAFRRIREHLEPAAALEIELPWPAARPPSERKRGEPGPPDLIDRSQDPFVPCLHPSMLLAGAQWACSLGSAAVITGVSQCDLVQSPEYVGPFPDERREFIQAFNYMLETALPARRGVRVEAPLIDLSKSEVIQLARMFGVPLEMTWSSYTDQQSTGGLDRGSFTRAHGFLRAGVPDPALEVDIRQRKQGGGK